MKLFRISLLLFCVVLFSSCVAEWGPRDCDSRFTLLFEYSFLDENVFDDNIHVVDVFIFDTNGNLVQYHTRRRDQLSNLPRGGGARSTTTYPGMVLTLDEGDYRVVVWANADRARVPFGALSVGSHINNARIGHAHPTGGTPLHYGPATLRDGQADEFMISVPDWQNRNEYAIIPFSRAHIEIQVFVVDASEHPTIDVTDVTPFFDFDRERDYTGGRTSFRNIANTFRQTPGDRPRQARFVSFYVPLFDEDTDKSLVISNTGGVLQNGVISISNFLAGIGIDGVQNPKNITNLADTDNPEMVIPIIIEIAPDSDDNDVIVSITGAHWIPVDVTPVNP